MRSLFSLSRPPFPHGLDGCVITLWGARVASYAKLELHLEFAFLCGWVGVYRACVRVCV